jgi:hypothetical protein
MKMAALEDELMSLASAEAAEGRRINLFHEASEKELAL